MDDLGENPIFGNTKKISPNSNMASFWVAMLDFRGVFFGRLRYIGKEPLSYSQTKFGSKMF